MLSVKDYGALGDYNPTTQIGTDDRAAFAIAVAAAIAAGKALRIPPGKYYLSKYVLVDGARGLNIKASAFATIYYGSDDLADGTRRDCQDPRDRAIPASI